MKTKFTALLILAASAVLVWSNPTSDDYTRFLRAKALEEVLPKAVATYHADPEHEAAARKLVSAWFDDMDNSILRSSIDRSDFLLFSIHEFHLGTFVVRRDLGIVETFVPLGSDIRNDPGTPIAPTPQEK